MGKFEIREEKMEKIIKEENPFGYKPVGKLLASMAIPAVVANLVNALYNIVDQIFIGQGVGYLGNAATNIAFPITTICLAITWEKKYRQGKGSCRNSCRDTCNYRNFTLDYNIDFFKTYDDFLRGN